MGINIKHDEYEQAIRELAGERNLTLTDAIGTAVLAELARGRAARRTSYLDQFRQAQTLIRTLPIRDDRSADDLVGYDERGLPA